MLHLITLRDWPSKTIQEVLDLASAIKAAPQDYEEAMRRKTLFMIFEKPSLRTRVSFEAGMNQLGGHAIFYDLTNSPLGAGKENVHDTVKTISRYGDIIMARLFEHEKIEEMAKHAEIPVINGLTDFSHPCQILADLLTVSEHKGALKGLRLAYFGDSNNNVTHSLLYGCAKMGIHIQIGCPEDESYCPQPHVIEEASAFGKQTGATIQISHDPAQAIAGANIVYTDSWMSYHIPQDEFDKRVKCLKRFQVTSDLMTYASAEAIFMNCLPAMRGYEQTSEIIDGPQSVVFDQAENRIHAQKAVLIKVLSSM